MCSVNIHQIKMHTRPEIISIGDELPTFYCQPLFHSSFNDIINFSYNDKVISVCNKKIGKGPVNIVINNFPINEIQSIIIFDNNISLNNKYSFSIHSHKHLVYSSLLNKTSFSDNSLIISTQKTYKNNIEKVTEYLLKLNIDKSLIFLLDTKREKAFNTLIEKKFMNKFKNGVLKILNNKTINGISEIKGLGFGLTPSGDDFIIGFLAALNLISIILNKNFDSIIEKIYQTAKTNNKISNTFLYFAMQNKYFETFKNFLTSISTNTNENSNNMEYFLNKMISLGHTSGIDTLTGFIIGNSIFLDRRFF